jgi:serine/threonine protein kinase
MLEALGHHRILDRVGSGGIGELYRARDTRLGRTTALRVVARRIAGDPDGRERFLRDAQAAAALSHPNIAALYEIGEDQNELFLVLEFVPGEVLEHMIGGRPLHPRRAVEFAAQIADGLAEGHAHSIVHRDIASRNIIVTPKDKAKIVDFGLAAWTRGGTAREHASGADAAAAFAAAGPALSTLASMSPEQARGDSVDHRTDLFSLGAVLFEMLSGRPPFTGNTAAAVALQIAQARPIAPSTVTRTVPPELDAIVARALAKNLDERYDSAAALAAELRSVAAILDVRTQRSESAARAPSPIATRRRRSSVRWIVLTFLAAVLIAAMWFARDAIQSIWNAVGLTR